MVAKKGWWKFWFCGAVWAVSVFSLLCGNSVQASGGDLPQSQQTAPLTTEKAREITTDTVELRDAPIRTAFELLFDANRVDFAIDNAVVDGDVTLSYTNKSTKDGLELLLRAAPIGIDYTLQSKVYLVKLNLGAVNRKPIPSETSSPRYAKNKKVVSSYRSEREVPRRVSGILRHDVRTEGKLRSETRWYAILETGDLQTEYAYPIVEIVQVGVRPFSPNKNGPAVHVVGITLKGVTLQTDGGKPFDVPLAPLRAQ